MSARSASFDIVIVGGGAAGCVVAARVTAATSGSVLLLEAGPDLRTDPPEAVRDGWGMLRGQLDWGYVSEPGWFGEGRKVRRLKVLGGTSWITRFAMRGSPADYDEWAALGNARWTWEGALPYFRQLERDLEFGKAAWHGDGGPIPITQYPEIEPAPVHAAAIEAMEAAGFARVDDHNRPSAVGVGRMPMNSWNGLRVTTAMAYLPVDSTPSNLTIRSDAEVAEVVVDRRGAGGVRLLDGTTINARRVVLCAGTYGSPAILLRSGIGPAEELRGLGIPVRNDLPGVGRNLSDHPTVSLDGGYRGPYRASPLVHTAATFHSPAAPAGSPPDLMLWVTDPDAPDSPPQWAIEVVLLKPRCRGRLTLRSADPTEPPRIELPDPRDGGDLERLEFGIRRAVDVLGDPGLRALCPDPVPAIGTRSELDAVIAEGYYSVPHVVGTCAMGPSPEAGAVVDGAGRVHGTDGLFVVDASIIPTEPSGFTHLPTIMLAERLSEIIAAGR